MKCWDLHYPSVGKCTHTQNGLIKCRFQLMMSDLTYLLAWKRGKKYICETFCWNKRRKALLPEDGTLWNQKTRTSQWTKQTCEYEKELRRRFETLENTKAARKKKMDFSSEIQHWECKLLEIEGEPSQYTETPKDNTRDIQRPRQN